MAPMSKTVLVTGAAGGIGGAVVQRFLAGGWKVAAVDVQQIDVQPIAGAADVLAIAADLLDVAQCRAAVEQAVAWGARLDAVVNAAGLWTEGPSADTTEAEWDRVLGVNLKGLYFVTSAAIPHLAATAGCVINLSSDAGIQGNAGAAVYCASKGGVSMLTKALALELAPQGIRVNAVCPGDVDSPMLRGQAANFGGGDQQAYLGEAAGRLSPRRPRTLHRTRRDRRTDLVPGPTVRGTDHRRQHLHRLRVVGGDLLSGGGLPG